MSHAVKRWMMRRTLTAEPISEVWDARSLSLQDTTPLGKLMYEAYHGTIDDEGETLEAATKEIQETVAGKYGPLLAKCSFLIEAQEEPGRVLAASVITAWTDDQKGHTYPLLAFLMTHPDAKGKGMGTFLLKKSMNALLAEGETELVLFVTVGNHAAQHLYQKLDFQVEEEFETTRIKSE